MATGSIKISELPALAPVPFNTEFVGVDCNTNTTHRVELTEIRDTLKTTFVQNAQTASMLQPYVLTASTASMLQPYVLTASTASMLQPYVLTASTASMLQPYVLNSKTASFATTGSNTFTNTQTINGNLFLSGGFRLVYNNDPTTNMLFGQFDGSTIHGPYYQLFGNQYSNLAQRGGAEFVYDTRNGGDANFHISSFNGSTWTQKFRVDDNGVQITGSLQLSGSISIYYDSITSQVKTGYGVGAIDLSSGEYVIQVPGVYVIAVGSGSNLRIPVASSWIGQSITIINKDGSNSITLGGNTVKNKGTGNNLTSIGTTKMYTLYSDGDTWYGGEYN